MSVGGFFKPKDLDEFVGGSVNKEALAEFINEKIEKKGGYYHGTSGILFILEFPHEKTYAPHDCKPERIFDTDSWKCHICKKEVEPAGWTPL